MTPEESQRLQACLVEAAAILYRNTPASELTTFESLDSAVRTHLLEQVGTHSALFLSSKLQAPTLADNDR